MKRMARKGKTHDMKRNAYLVLVVKKVNMFMRKSMPIGLIHVNFGRVHCYED